MSTSLIDRSSSSCRNTDLAFASRPYIALCRGLIAEGHRATIVTHEEYKAWVEGFGVGHRVAGGDPGALMKLSVEHSVSDQSSEPSSWEDVGQSANRLPAPSTII